MTKAYRKYPSMRVTSTSLVECKKYLECFNKTLWDEGEIKKTRHMEKFLIVVSYDPLLSLCHYIYLQDRLDSIAWVNIFGCFRAHLRAF